MRFTIPAKKKGKNRRTEIQRRVKRILIKEKEKSGLSWKKFNETTKAKNIKNKRDSLLTELQEIIFDEQGLEIDHSRPDYGLKDIDTIVSGGQFFEVLNYGYKDESELLSKTVFTVQRGESIPAGPALFQENKIISKGENKKFRFVVNYDYNGEKYKAAGVTLEDMNREYKKIYQKLRKAQKGMKPGTYPPGIDIKMGDGKKTNFLIIEVKE